MLNPAIDQLRHYAQFILWKAEWDEKKGKFQKFPCAPDGTCIDAHNPAHWMDAETASAYSQSTGYGLAFVLTEADPFFCLDLDKCIVDGQWTPIAAEMFNIFPGAAIEQSYSGQGAHIWGAYRGELPPRRKRRDDLGLELYTEKRFIALTNNFIQGNVWIDFTTGLHYLIDRYFKKSKEETEASWTDGPREDWDGYEDDAMLIHAMLKSRSASALFGGRCTPKDLWECNVEKLAEVFPSDSEDDFNRSAADAALLAHLAFWTGGDCERMERLFGMSGLVRDKWTEREDYRHRSILHAVANLKDVFKFRSKSETAPDKREEPAPALSTEVLTRKHENDPNAPKAREGYSIKNVQEQIEHFAGCVYVSELHEIFIPDGRLVKPEVFNALYGGYKFIIDADGKATKKAFEAFTLNEVVDFPKARGIIFRPDLESGRVYSFSDGPMLNTFVPPRRDFKAGDVSPFLDFMARFLPNERDRRILMSYLAAMVQFPGVKFQWTVLLQGTEGNGKTSIARIMQHAMGEQYTHFADAQDLGSRFNSWLLNKTFIAVEEVKVRGRWEVMERLKWMISNERGPIQGKGKDQITADLRANFIMCTNHLDAITKTRNDRRWCVFYTGQQDADDLIRDGMTEEYFRNYYDWLKGGGYDHVAHYLLHLPIDDEFNPAGGCQRAPETSRQNEVLSNSVTPQEQAILDSVLDADVGFRNGWISSAAVAKVFERKRYAVPRRSFNSLLENLGYSRAEGLPGGQMRRASRCVVDSGKRPTLYVNEEKINDPAYLEAVHNKTVEELYESDQL